MPTQTPPELPELIVGGRVRLRPLQPEHGDDLLQAVASSRARLDRWLRWPRDICSRADADARIARLADEWANRTRLNWGIWETSSGGFVGEIAIVRAEWGDGVFELGYWLRAEAEGRGLVSEAVALVTLVAFEHFAANRVVIRAEADNVRSRRVAERLGFVHEGTLRRDHLGPMGGPVDTAVHALVRGDDLSCVKRAVGVDRQRRAASGSEVG